MHTSIPTHIKLLQKQRILEIHFDDGQSFELSCAMLRASSPSAEMRKQSQPVTIKDDVNIVAIEPVGNYGVKLVFDDGHQTGIYSWAYLYELGISS